jgi:hypothetical protein
LDVLRLQYLLGVPNICIALFSTQFFLIFFRNSYGPAKFIEVATFHPLYAQKSATNPDMCKRRKIHQAAAIF